MSCRQDGNRYIGTNSPGDRVSAGVRSARVRIPAGVRSAMQMTEPLRDRGYCLYSCKRKCDGKGVIARCRPMQITVPGDVSVERVSTPGNPLAVVLRTMLPVPVSLRRSLPTLPIRQPARRRRRPGSVELLFDIPDIRIDQLPDFRNLNG
jgi:hypothetical protein